jgi:hypothetical protein
MQLKCLLQRELFICAQTARRWAADRKSFAGVIAPLCCNAQSDPSASRAQSGDEMALPFSGNPTLRHQ